MEREGLHDSGRQRAAVRAGGFLRAAGHGANVAVMVPYHRHDPYDRARERANPAGGGFCLDGGGCGASTQQRRPVAGRSCADGGRRCLYGPCFWDCAPARDQHRS